MTKPHVRFLSFNAAIHLETMSQLAIQSSKNNNNCLHDHYLKIIMMTIMRCGCIPIKVLYFFVTL